MHISPKIEQSMKRCACHLRETDKSNSGEFFSITNATAVISATVATATACKSTLPAELMHGGERLINS